MRLDDTRTRLIVDDDDEMHTFFEWQRDRVVIDGLNRSVVTKCCCVPETTACLYHVDAYIRDRIICQGA
jgi:hypothetical protein